MMIREDWYLSPVIPNDLKYGKAALNVIWLDKKLLEGLELFKSLSKGNIEDGLLLTSEFLSCHNRPRREERGISNRSCHSFGGGIELLES